MHHRKYNNQPTSQRPISQHQSQPSHKNRPQSISPRMVIQFQIRRSRLSGLHIQIKMAWQTHVMWWQNQPLIILVRPNRNHLQPTGICWGIPPLRKSKRTMQTKHHTRTWHANGQLHCSKFRSKITPPNRRRLHLLPRPQHQLNRLWRRSKNQVHLLPHRPYHCNGDVHPKHFQTLPHQPIR